MKDLAKIRPGTHEDSADIASLMAQVSSGERTTTIVGGAGTGFLYAVPVTAKTVQGKAIFVKRK